MEHTIIISAAAGDTGGLTPFCFVRVETVDGRQVGLRVCGYAAVAGAADRDMARAAVEYGITTARARLGLADSLLFTAGRAALLEAANDALRESESPCTLERVEFAWVDTGPAGSPLARYSGIIIGQNGVNQHITVTAPAGPRDWPCVCGHWNGPRKRVCGQCKLKKPKW